MAYRRNSESIRPVFLKIIVVATISLSLLGVSIFAITPTASAATNHTQKQHHHHDSSGATHSGSQGTSSSTTSSSAKSPGSAAYTATTASTTTVQSPASAPQVTQYTDLANAAFISPTAVQRGHTYTVWVVDKNRGTLDVSGHWVTVYLSSTSTRTSSSTVVGQVFVQALTAGATKVLKIHVTIPDSSLSGLQHFVSFVNSQNNNIIESNVNNNQHSYPVMIVS